MGILAACMPYLYASIYLIAPFNGHVGHSGVSDAKPGGGHVFLKVR